MSLGLVLSLFPGADLLGRAFEEVGFCVVRGPDKLWGGDVRAFHAELGDAIANGQPRAVGENARRVLSIHMLGNGVPRAMGLYLARHVARCLEQRRESA